MVSQGGPFGATRTYWAQAAANNEKKSANRANVEHKAALQEQEKRERLRQKERKKELRQKWQSLDSNERTRIAGVVKSMANSEHVRRSIESGNLTDHLVELACLKQLEAECGA